MKKKILVLMLVSTMTIICVACGNKTSSNNTDTSSTESIESVSIIETDEYKTQDIKAEDLNDLVANGDTSVVTEDNKESVKSENKTKANDNAVASKPSESDKNNLNNNNSSKKNDNYQNNGSANNTNNNDNNNGSDNNVSTEKTHIHSWDGGTVTAQATCTTDGIKTYSCSCGETKTENISALGHDMVHYDATSHSEQKLVKEAWTETIYGKRCVCNGCGAQFESDDDAIEHIADADITSVCQNYFLKKVPIDTKYHEAQYETVQVSDNNAYDVCTRCGYKN